MSLDLEPVQLSSLFVNSLSIVKEKAAARRHAGSDAPSGLDQADAAQLSARV
jgi:hypothetical protein